MSSTTYVPKVLTIAGSDSGGGAESRDLKTFTTLSVYGTSVITAITAQNTLGVQDVHPLPIPAITSQLRSVLTDIPIDAAKTGMLFDAATITAVCRTLNEYRVPNLVVDPVMVATSGDVLLAHDAVSAMVESLFPLATVVTPNVPEAERLVGFPVKSVEDMRSAARALHGLMGGGDAGRARWALVKGGHMPLDAEGRAVGSGGESAPVVVLDVLFDGTEFVEFRNPFVRTRNTHGTGCTLSAAIVAGLAKGFDVPKAVADAMTFLAKAISTTFPVGSGSGPLNHFHQPDSVAEP
ncbi:phosphomethylpyrimidine kinase [Blyttiomyces helicus]|uniref:Phosphomethylpyrimidine kinase n=1 Tax=Blyttiomyces helicus TaxID=388810 RepID=A0A4P9WBX9_9FUNG|nr:phosphomethylpyrimidine kinase [Blyttiomyces helicus]|eukprot:RKO90141.1 phosphomethylpyrimidine kinase [Blyttiomyces helicus]